MAPDFQIAEHKGVVLFTPLTDEAQEWWVENVAEGVATGTYAVDQNFARQIQDGIAYAGLEMLGTGQSS